MPNLFYPWALAALVLALGLLLETTLLKGMA